MTVPVPSSTTAISDRRPLPGALALSRRALLAAGGAATLGIGLSGCLNGGDEPGDGAGQGNQGGLGNADAFAIPDPAPGYPTDPVTVRWTESSQFSLAVLPTFWKAYQAKHPNVTITYDNLPDTDLAKVLQLAFSSGDLPDVFRLLGQIIPSGLAVSQGLVQPLDDVIPDFAAWKATFPSSAFIEGINMFEGKTYTFPMLGPFTQVLQYNKAYLDQAGIDPSADPFTFDTFRAAAKKLTAQGAGKYHGLAIGGADVGRWSSFVSILGNLAGAVGDTFDYRRGTYNYTSDGYAAVIELLLGLKSDGSVDPAAVSVNSDQARSKLPGGQCAMIINETGVLPIWSKQFPDFTYGVANPPQTSPDHMIGTSPAGQTFYWVAASSTQQHVIGDILHYLGSDDGLVTWQQVGGGALPVVKPQANADDSLDPRLRSAYTFFDQRLRMLPSPEARTPGSSTVAQKLQPVNPAFGAVVQGIFTGQLDNPAKALSDLQARSEKALDTAMTAANKAGAKVSRDDWVFPNWDPTKSYTQDDYAKLS